MRNPVHFQYFYQIEIIPSLMRDLYPHKKKTIHHHFFYKPINFLKVALFLLTSFLCFAFPHLTESDFKRWKKWEEKMRKIKPYATLVRRFLRGHTSDCFVFFFFKSVSGQIFFNYFCLSTSLDIVFLVSFPQGNSLIVTSLFCCYFCFWTSLLHYLALNDTPSVSIYVT